MSARWFVILVMLVSFSHTSQGRDAFLLKLDVSGDVGDASFTKIEDMANALTDEGLSQIVASYTPTSAATAVLDVRGLPATAQYGANSTTLVFTVPSLAIRVEFTGATRDESDELFKDWLKGNGGDIFTGFLQGLAEQSPIDPVAGNPNSLMAMMALADFDAGSGIGPTGFGTPLEEKRPNFASFGIRFGQYTAQDFDTNVYVLPLRYTISLSDPRKSIIIDAPFTYIDSSGSSAYNGSLGIGLRLPATKHWRITPAVRIAAAYSSDLGSMSAIYSVSATSDYRLYFGDLTTTIGNMLGYYLTDSIDAGDYNIDYDLENTIFRNGVAFEGSLGLHIFGEPTSWQLSFVDTRFFGDALFIEQYNDVAISFGSRHRPGSPDWRSMRLGITYTWGENNFNGAQINFGYQF